MAQSFSRPRAIPWPCPRFPVLPSAFFSDWAYTNPNQRDLRIDFLRGFAVFVMIVDHFGGASWLYLLTGNNSFFVSGAEAFVFLSGLVVGMVYGGIAQKQGLRIAQIKSLTRAFTLYKLTVVLTLSFSLLSHWLALPWANDLQIDQPLQWFINVVTLQQTFYLSDVMLLYTFLMTLASGALWLLINRRTLLLVGMSFGLWGYFQFFPANTSFPWNIAGNSTFHLMAWQLLFFVAMALGFHRDAFAEKLKQIPRAPYFWLMGALFLWLVEFSGDGAVFLTRVFPDVNAESLMRALFAKSALGPGRLLASYIVFQFAYLAATLAWKPLWTMLGWFLIPLGQNALYCYIVHIFFVGVVRVGFQVFPAVPTVGGLNTTLQGLTLWLIWAMTQRKVLFNFIPR
jgi:hypothetical protein